MGRDSRIAMVRLGADSKHFMQDLRDAERATQTWGNRVKGHITKSLRSGFGGLSGITGLAGIAGFGSMARDVMKFNEGLVDLQISAGKSRGEMLAFNKALQQTAAATGAQQEELLAGAQKYTELTGKFDDFAASMDTFAKASVATGASMESLVATAAALSGNMGVGPEQMLQVFDVLTAQGKMGKVEIKDMAAEFAGLTSQFSRFAKGAGGSAQLGAWMQTLARGAPSAAEAATQLEALMATVSTSHEKLAKLGVNVWADKAKTQMKDLAVIADDILAKVPISKLGQITERKEFQNALNTFRQNRAAFGEFNDTASMGGTVMKDFGKRAEEAPMKMAKAMAHLKAVFNEALMKNLDALVTAFEAIVKALSWMASHPEAMVALAALWKGGGFLGTIGGLGMGAGGGGVGGALGAGAAGAAGNARGARFVQGLGGAMQGAAVGYALSQTGQRLNSNFDALSTAGMTAAGALAGLGGPLGMLGVAIMGIKMAADLFIAGIDERENKRAKRTLDEFFLDRTSEVGVGSGGVNFGPTRAGQRVHDRQRAGAQSIMTEAKAQGFLREDGTIDEKAMEAFVDSQPGWGKDEKARAKAGFRAAVRITAIDHANAAATPEQVSTGPLFDEAGANGPGFMEQNPGGPGSVMKQTVEIALKLLPGVTIVDDKSNRRKSR